VSDPETLAAYAREADTYERTVDPYNTRDPRLRNFIAACPPGGRVLDLGCGPGAAAREMAKAGLAADAMDAAPEFVTKAAKHPGVKAWQATFDEIKADSIYDGIWANFSLLHARRADFPRHLAALRHALKPGGVFYIGMKLGTGEQRDRLGRFYTYYTQDELERLLQDAGFTVTGVHLGEGKGLEGTVQPWISVAAHG
jgi:SAM-dependent methyltransferase